MSRYAPQKSRGRAGRSGAGAAARAAACALLLGICAAPAAAAKAPAAAPLPELAPRSRAALAEAAPRETAAPTPLAQRLEQLVIGGFSAERPTPVSDGEVASAIRRAFAGRRLSDAAGRDAGSPVKPRSGKVGFVLADPRRSAILERRFADERMIPASVAKAPTALYALDALGPEHRFETRLVMDGALSGGVLKGDLYLVGGGDPTLDIRDLGELAEAAAQAGLIRVDGRFFYDDTALPRMEAITPSQPPQASYNPALSGLMLNFNRVRVLWTRLQDGRHQIDVRSSASKNALEIDHVAAVAVPSGAAATGFSWSLAPRIVGPGLREGARELWRISARLLNSRGGRWMPVRRPGAFAAAVFQEKAHQAGVSLPPPQRRAAPASAQPLATHLSRPLPDILRGMLRFSTNLTAEAVGLAASRARGLERLELERSSALMSSWADTRFGILGSTAEADAAPSMFRNHSGLSVESRLTPRAMAAILIEAARNKESFDAFFELLPRYRLRGAPKGVVVRAKTGTVYYGRGLAGYLQCPSGRRLAFAYLHSDIEGRAAFDAKYDPASGGRPRGAGGWLARARDIEKKLLIRWSKAHC
ncbi:MAG: D-alanyl-D-alanine carboxypeptidase/D-alanyl-D-alanine-endopeptidase [Pseudomonadota bacterium]